jgi:hypothetical protein
MNVVRFGNEIGDGQLQLMDPKPARLILRREIMARAQKEQDVGGLADQQRAAPEKGRRKGRVFHARAFEKFLQSRHAAFAPCDIDVSAPVCEGEPHCRT